MKSYLICQQKIYVITEYNINNEANRLVKVKKEFLTKTLIRWNRKKIRHTIIYAC